MSVHATDLLTLVLQCMQQSFSIRNVSCDYYLSDQTKFVNEKTKHLDGPLPVVRVFGITQSGMLLNIASMCMLLKFSCFGVFY